MTVCLVEAKKFIHSCYQELGKSEVEINNRIEEITNDIAEIGMYEHTYEELSYGAKLAWRNSNRCIGRLFWQSLQVIDRRELDNVQEIAGALFHHIDYATNEGRVRPVITIFKPKTNGQEQVRIWNHQLLRYAGYKKQGIVRGDLASLAFTKKCESLGWRGEGTDFDLLPLVIQVRNEAPKWFEIDKSLVIEVPITHPDYNQFNSLNIKWYSVPIISDMKLEIGGIDYTAAPFNGWYMVTEIAARNLADESRYNLLLKIAEIMGLDTSKNGSYWKDRALIELNIAVLHSFQQAGVQIVDHHTAAEQFQLFEKKEAMCKREITGDWTWLIPPVSPATTHIFHQDYKDEIVKPNYFYQEQPYVKRSE